MLSFDEPLFFLALIPVAAVITLQAFWRGRGGRISFSLSTWKGPQFRYTPGWLKLILLVRNFGFYLALVMVVFALAGPSFLERELVYLSEGTNFMVVLDESPSMAGRDFEPESRFDAALRVINQFIESREKDPIGLVTFGSQAALRVPPTLDYDFIRSHMESLRIESLGIDTAIGMGVALGSLHLQSAPRGERIMILLTDGVNNFGQIQPETAAEMAANLGIRIYTIGIGTTRRVNVEYVRPDTLGTETGQQENILDEDILQRIAQRTGGEYFPARSLGSLENVFRNIDSRESQERKVRQEVISRPFHMELILLVLGLFSFVFVLNKLVLREVF